MKSNRQKHLQLFLALLLPLLGSELAHASGVLIPITDSSSTEIQAPASDLAKDGTQLDRDEVMDLIQAGQDVSLLDPVTNNLWAPPALPVLDDSTTAHPENGATLNYDSDLPSPKDMLRTRVATQNGNYFSLTLSLDIHGALIRAALLRALGYRFVSPRHYEELTLRFPSVAIRDRFLDSLSDQTRTDRNRWVKHLPENIPEVTLQDLLLEPGRIQVPSFYWGAMSRPVIQGRRAIRALIVPLALLDLSAESINLYSWELGKILGGRVSLTHPFADQFEEVTFDDARWIARKIARLTRKDLAEAVAAGKLPAAVQRVVLEKVIARRNHMVELFRLRNELPKSERKFSYDTSVSQAPELSEGKIVTEHFDGHAERFTHGDPSSPMKMDEVARFLLQDALSRAITAATQKLNELLEIRGASDVALQHQKDVWAQFLEHIQKNPTQPFEKSLSAWAGPTGGIRVNANRNLITGSYYGSDSVLQLVDNIGAQASVGFFMGLDGVETIIPRANGNLSIQRNYIHVRPIPSAKAALKTGWQSLMIPGFMKHLGNFLEPETCREVIIPPPFTSGGSSSSGTSVYECEPEIPSEKLAADKVSKNIDKLFTEFQEGEIFMITDTLSLGLGASASIPISALITADLSGTSGAISLGAQGQAQILRKTTIERTKKGFHVYVQNARIGSAGLSFDFNFWMKILRASHTERLASAEVHAHLIGEKPKDEAEQRKMLVTLNALLKGNNPELMEANYPYYNLIHSAPSDASRVKLLSWSWVSMEEAHRLQIDPPADPQKRYVPSDHRRTFFRHRLMQRSGRNDFGLLTDVLGGLLPDYELGSSSSDDNPANTFLGKSKWTNTTSEAETTRGKESVPYTMIERHWQGWNLSKEKLFKIFDGIEARAQSLKLDYPLFQRDFFNNLKRLELYDVQSNLVIYDSGVAKLRDEMSSRRARSELSLFQFLVDLEGRERFLSWCEGEFLRNKPTGGSSHDPRTRALDLLAGREWIHECTKPWMVKVLKLSRKPPTDVEKKIRWTTELMHALESGADFGNFLQWLGKDNFFFQVRVSGFRKGQEDGDSTIMSGSRGETDYVSSSIGSLNPDVGSGPLKTLANQTGISSYQLYARFLSEAQ